MNIWFIIILLVSAVEIGIVAGKNGQRRDDRYSIGLTMVSYTIYLFLVFKAVQTGF